MYNEDEEIADFNIAVVLFGEFDPAFMRFLQWKNTSPLSSNLVFLHFDESGVENAMSHQRNYVLNPLPGKLDEVFAESPMVFMAVAHTPFVPLFFLHDVLGRSRLLSRLTMLYLSSVLYTHDEIEVLRGMCHSIIVSDKSQPVPDISPEDLQQKIQSYNDLIFISLIESISNSILLPGFICMDFADILTVVAENAQAYIGSAIINETGSMEVLVEKLHACDMLQMNLHKGTGVYVMLLCGENRGRMEEFNGVCDGLYDIFDESCTFAIGCRYNKYLAPDELQLTLLACIDPQFAERQGFESGGRLSCSTQGRDNS